MRGDFVKGEGDMLLGQRGMVVGFPMPKANAEDNLLVGKDFTLTEDQILDLLEHGELHAEGMRSSVEAHGSARARHPLSAART